MKKWTCLGLPLVLLASPASAGKYITIASGSEAAPQRSIYVADFDLVARKLEGGSDPNSMAMAAMQSPNPLDYMESRTIYKMNVYQIFESGAPIAKGGPTNFIHYVLDFKCRDRTFAIPEATAYDRAGRTQKSSAPEWRSVPANWIGQAYKIACKAPEWEEAMASARKMATDFQQGKKSKKPLTDPFRPLNMQMVGDYVAITDLIDQIWSAYWSDARQPEYESTMSAEEFAAHKAKSIAALEAQAKEIGKMAQDVETDLRMQDSMSKATNATDQRFVQELQGMAGRSEEEVVSIFGVPASLNVNGNVRQLDWYWSETRQEQVPVTADVMGCNAHFCGKQGEAVEYHWQTVQVNCRRTLWFREGGTQPGYRLFDFRAGCS